MLYKNIIIKAAERLRGYCSKQKDCERCLFKKCGGCELQDNVPANWLLPGEKEVAAYES